MATSATGVTLTLVSSPTGKRLLRAERRLNPPTLPPGDPGDVHDPYSDPLDARSLTGYGEPIVPSSDYPEREA